MARELRALLLWGRCVRAPLRAPGLAAVPGGGSVLCPRRTALQSPGPRRHLAWSAPSGRRLSTRAAQGEDEERPRAGVRSTESVHGSVSKHEFQAETKKLLDIVARSLYSEKEVFIRELISNASDALEKLRHKLVSGGQALPDMEIHLQTDAEKGTITIQDSGIGMTREELVSNLGTIARSGSKAFLEALQSQAEASSRIIGQFGVGFYSAFMVADRVEVYSRPAAPESQGHQWLSDGSGVFEVAEASGVKTGTKIILHLKPDCKAFSDEARVRDVVTKYSNFVSFPLYLNGKRINTLQAIWMMDPKGVSEEQHEEFYRYIAQAYDKPRYTLHYKTDAPLNIRSLFYVPETKPSMFDVSRELGSSVALYSRKVLIQTKATDVLPKWLRFVRGVVDSEDIPLNLSRELLQESALISCRHADGSWLLRLSRGPSPVLWLTVPRSHAPNVLVCASVTFLRPLLNLPACADRAGPGGRDLALGAGLGHQAVRADCGGVIAGPVVVGACWSWLVSALYLLILSERQREAFHAPAYSSNARDSKGTQVLGPSPAASRGTLAGSAPGLGQALRCGVRAPRAGSRPRPPGPPAPRPPLQFLGTREL
uniref:Histidine kinase/HSP90-like ATPase domain-containing protein n=1 Tax=Oryctolagus cuniculus TaxID=9986 RepID=G1T139_RABIT